jgi:hypothetical protein
LKVFEVVGWPVRQLGWTPDGRRLALSRGSSSSGVVLISDSK